MPVSRVIHLPVSLFSAQIAHQTIERPPAKVCAGARQCALIHRARAVIDRISHHPRIRVIVKLCADNARNHSVILALSWQHHSGFCQMRPHRLCRQQIYKQKQHISNADASHKQDQRPRCMPSEFICVSAPCSPPHGFHLLFLSVFRCPSYALS